MSRLTILNIIWPAIGEGGSGVAAPVIGTNDDNASHASFAHLAEGDYLFAADNAQ
jgi:hypothetical protein